MPLLVAYSFSVVQSRQASNRWIKQSNEDDNKRKHLHDTLLIVATCSFPASLSLGSSIPPFLRKAFILDHYLCLNSCLRSLLECIKSIFRSHFCCLWSRQSREHIFTCFRQRWSFYRDETKDSFTTPLRVRQKKSKSLLTSSDILILSLFLFFLNNSAHSLWLNPSLSWPVLHVNQAREKRRNASSQSTKASRSFLDLNSRLI